MIETIYRFYNVIISIYDIPTTFKLLYFEVFTFTFRETVVRFYHQLLQELPRFIDA